ncbi:uncharacterized protein LOC143273982 isoform X2 [Peromyscus maniculatus bairdii]|uniref:uncharacterized protein LOC143273982 isoform X2 n=1 Tax=Peromyscus maniculatus bairdii TaxID=230844 RepID=UPI003FD298AD
MKKMARGRRHPWAPSHPAPSVTAPPPTAPEGPAAPTAAPKQRRMRFLLSPQLPVAYEEGGTNQRSPPTDAKDGVKTPACREQLNRPVVPHPFKIGDSVWVRRHQSRNLEPRLTGQRLGSTRRM